MTACLLAGILVLAAITVACLPAAWREVIRQQDAEDRRIAATLGEPTRAQVEAEYTPTFDALADERPFAVAAMFRAELEDVEKVRWLR